MLHCTVLKPIAIWVFTYYILMSDMWYTFLNIFFFVFHTLFTLFNMVGWAFPKTRKLHLITLSLTAFSWFILGIWYGWGFCFCTQWHWEVRRKLGFTDESNSYIHFLILKVTGLNLSEDLVEKGTLIVFLICIALSLVLNIKGYRKNVIK